MGFAEHLLSEATIQQTLGRRFITLHGMEVMDLATGMAFAD